MNTVDIYGDYETMALIMNKTISSFEDDTIRKITSYAFKDCSSLSQIYLPLVSHAGSNAFAKTGLKEIVLPQLSILGTGFCQSCFNLMSVSLNSELQSIASYAFYDCKKLIDLFPPLTEIKTIHGGALTNCALSIANAYPLSSYTFKLQECNRNLSVFFYFTETIRLLNYPAITYGNYTGAFEGMINLKKVILNSSSTNKYMPSYLFRYCYKLSSIEGLEYVDGFGDECLYGTRLGEEISLNSCSVIYTSAFRACLGLRKVNLGSYIYSIGSSAFAECANLEQIVINTTSEKISSLYIHNSAFSISGASNNVISIFFPDDLVEYAKSKFTFYSNHIYGISEIVPLRTISYLSATFSDNDVDKSYVTEIVDSYVTSLTSDMLKPYTKLISLTCPNVSSLYGYVFGACNMLLKNIFLSNCNSVHSGFMNYSPPYVSNYENVKLGSSLYNFDSGVLPHCISELTIYGSGSTCIFKPINNVYGNKNLKVFFPELQTISYNYPFSYTTYNVCEFSFPNVNCIKCSTVRLSPLLEGHFPFLKKLDFPVLSKIELSSSNNTYKIFMSCYNLSQLILRSNSIVDVNRSFEFDSDIGFITQFNIFVPDALLSDYKNHSVWGNHSSIILPISQLPSE